MCLSKDHSQFHISTTQTDLTTLQLLAGQCHSAELDKTCILLESVDHVDA